MNWLHHLLPIKSTQSLADIGRSFAKFLLMANSYTLLLAHCDSRYFRGPRPLSESFASLPDTAPTLSANVSSDRKKGPVFFRLPPLRKKLTVSLWLVKHDSLRRCDNECLKSGILPFLSFAKTQGADHDACARFCAVPSGKSCPLWNCYTNSARELSHLGCGRVLSVDLK
jgi:hypothetical protein